MDFMDISKMRITVRQFSKKEVEKEKIDKILEAGRWAPTAVNYQPQRIIVLNSSENLKKVREFCTFGYDKKYADLAKECFDEKGQQNIYYYGSPLVLMVCYDKDVCWKHPKSNESSGIVDASIVSTHMMLEAASIGLGTVWISYFDKDKARKLLNIPNNWEMANMLYIGYPADDFTPNPNMSGKRYDVSHTARYNNCEVNYQSDLK